MSMRLKLCSLPVVGGRAVRPALRDYQVDDRRRQQACTAPAPDPCRYLPTGGGATIVAASLAKESVEGRVLFIVNRNTLLEQTSDAERAGVPENVGVLVADAQAARR